jgi:glycosyltransferase involved in cell wall biosynthesis
MVNNNFPLISCICITRGKPHLLQRAIGCFDAQTYANRELIILYEDDDDLVRNFLKQNTFALSVKIIEVSASPKRNLGELRNIAIAAASGEFICQWDEDDWCHAGRLSFQYEGIANTGYKASILTKWLIFDCTKGNAYISNERLWEGSILCSKSIIQQKKYEHLQMGEDTAVISYLKAGNYIFEMKDRMGLYIYVYHGHNTWHRTHWETIFRHSRALDKNVADLIQSILRGEYTNTYASRLIDELMLVNGPINQI